MDKENFGVATNLVISLLVVLYGAFAWLPFRTAKDRSMSPEPFRYRCYICWWISWLFWTLLWGWTGIRQSLGSSASNASELAKHQILLKIPDLIFDNINCIFLVLVFLTLTRGDAFARRSIWLAFGQVAGSLTTGFLILYALTPWLGLGFTYGIHDAWSLCMSAAAPILVGWAVYLRFNSLWVLAIGFVYAFMQPVAYAFDLQGAGTVSPEQIVQYQPVVDITLGGLKIFWAVIFIQFLAHGQASGKSLVAEMNNPGLPGKWDPRTVGHALVLGCVYVFLVVWMLMTFEGEKKHRIEEFSVSFGIVSGFIALLDIMWRIWRESVKVKAHTGGAGE